MHQRVAELCMPGNDAKRPHGGGPQFEVAVTAGNDELGVAGDAAQSALRSSASLWREVAQANQSGCSVCCPRTRGPC